MSKQDDGGAAFPSPGVIIPWLDPAARQQGACEGMTLRDYFAAKAVQGYVSDSDWRVDMDYRATANAAYMMADAMLKARQE